MKNLSLTALADLIRASISRPRCPGNWAETVGFRRRKTAAAVYCFGLPQPFFIIYRKRCIMPTPSRNAIYDATIRRMTACALEEAENRFAVEHAQDTEQQLADYLRKYADELGHTPWPREIPGGVTIQTRFGSWEAAVAEAGLPFPEHPNQPGKFRRVREETQRQRAIYRQKKAEKRERAKERMKAQEEKRRKNRQSGIT